ncbi:hypothetical protein ACFIJ5_17950 (plasmid) [Haloimpatiens sp. FM7330]|uniref:hypothetical protein n=1 Tax=Haloimpatiens sp. FM7330 TaxID=3298610 RepID=UPI0036365247
MNIEKVLKSYKLKKSLVESALERIKAYEFSLDHPEVIENYYTKLNMESSIPKSSYRKGSIVENILDKREITNENIMKLIQKERSRIFFTKLEVEQIENSLNALTDEERFIIECKYFDNMFWRDIEIKFNDKFREDNYITVAGLRKINSKVLNKLRSIIAPFYEE